MMRGRHIACKVLIVLAIIVTSKYLIAQPAREVVSEEALRQQVAKAPRLKILLASKAKPVAGKTPSMEGSLWKNSIILADGVKFTVIPLGAILHLPSDLRSHIVAKPQGEFTFWPNFLCRNSAWLSAKEVSLTLSRGNAKEANALIKGLAKDPHLVVATYKGGPITILEPAPPSLPPSARK